jgi:prepilin-type N-terminal cleavage/methylation domain-containing protein
MKIKGFTLIELLIVIAVLGLLATFVVISFTGSQAGARDTRRQSDIRQYQTSLEVYANRSNSLYPIQTSTVNIATALCGTLSLTNCPDDSTSGENYKYISNGSGTDYVLWAKLEKPNAAGATEYFILCSGGNVGKSTSAPSSANCPI